MNFKKIIRAIRNYFIRMIMVADDDYWYNHGQPGGMYPPSFYATHTEEEIREIYQRDMEELRRIVKKYNIDI
ncbi:MAG: hypothetical protein IJ079_07440 [Lachnospiraceae bacterium]|nr:hypothetical protein [Lachnospiraceae bacterium]